MGQWCRDVDATDRAPAGAARPRAWDTSGVTDTQAPPGARTPIATTVSQALLKRGSAVVPGGVNSPVRAFRAVGGTPRFMASAHGPWLRDADGTRYVDLVCSWGPMLLGHTHPEVLAAVRRVAGDGFSFGAPTGLEIELAEEIIGRVPAVQMLRLVNSGTEATMSAVRLARGFTGRPALVKFAGHYHGHVDALLAQAGSGLATFGLPSGPGITGAAAADTLVVPYNDEAALRAVFAAHGDRIACLITEAAAGNMGVVPPRPGFARLMRELTAAHGALLVYDEVMTGFRLSPGGWHGLEQAEAGLAGEPLAPPDLFTFGKVMGGGFPVAAFGGRADVMRYLAPLGPVYQAGTLSGNPVAVTAGLTTLRLADAAVYARVDEVAATLSAAADAAFDAVGLPHVVQRAGSMFSVFLTAGVEGRVDDYDTARTQDEQAFAAFFHAMLDAGVHLPPSAFESWFVSAAHDDAAVEHVLAALPGAARAAASARAAAGAGG